MDGESLELSKILVLSGFPEPWTFDGLYLNEENERVELRFSCPRGTRHDCPNCGVVDQPTHDFRDRIWEHRRFLEFRCFVIARIPRIRCGHCGSVRLADVPWARRGSGFTRSFEAQLLRMCKFEPVKSVSDVLGLGNDRLWRVIDHYAPRAVARENLKAAKRIGATRSRSKRVENT